MGHQAAKSWASLLLYACHKPAFASRAVNTNTMIEWAIIKIYMLASITQPRSSHLIATAPANAPADQKILRPQIVHSLVLPPAAVAVCWELAAAHLQLGRQHAMPVSQCAEWVCRMPAQGPPA
eukprot:CAMPEP_0202867890 /NCGR_PEP_ID=MMETSP1391-20130828/9690_1 /ASSEMBLY_ACC=CAM_ASM_000867 /TAXON_ID=1034604 /ORGANISM="Chlamydomonas leiostraca, Strain SAG 11-49" /LENGTH=122 /DNA_ID=CAMNT_0049547971 /DNA_START=61 /DNA_END=425 /DNA_ORIENTATION=+